MRHERSLPVWGEWIEMPGLRGPVRPARRLSPCGESGLKLRGGRKRWNACTSLPVWGEWIEIDRWKYMTQNVNASLPVWGEWIEISSFRDAFIGHVSLSPCGESGLK